MTNGSGPDHHDDCKIVKRKEMKNAAGKGGGKQSKPASTAKPRTK